jgi:hydrogenase maturation protease
MAVQKKLCILGVGNSLRGDDGIGPYIIHQLSRLQIRDAELLTSPSLQTDWMETIAGFEEIILVDAEANGAKSTRFHLLQPGEYLAESGSHYLGPGTFLALLTGLLHTSPRFHLCAVPGYDFGFQEGLSEQALEQSERAIGIIKRWLRENKYLE